MDRHQLRECSDRSQVICAPVEQKIVPRNLSHLLIRPRRRMGTSRLVFLKPDSQTKEFVFMVVLISSIKRDLIITPAFSLVVLSGRYFPSVIYTSRIYELSGRQAPPTRFCEQVALDQCDPHPSQCLIFFQCLDAFGYHQDTEITT